MGLIENLSIADRPAQTGDYVIVSDRAVGMVGCKPGDILFIDGRKQEADDEGFIWRSGNSI